MNRSDYQSSWRQLIRATGLLLASAVGAAVLAQPPADSLSEDVEYLTRGPLHEAFADPYQADPVPAPLVLIEPPEPIEELPPEYRPAGDNVEWIPGYWAWDEERDDFLWISGMWREFPPDQRWVPGYWVSAEGGYRWVSGFWAGTQLASVEYLPTPPESLERGPSSPPPQENYFYIPGHWVHDAYEYRWQPGFWTPVHENWVWVPAQYLWTPGGTVFRPGYWDYDIAYRGVVFTPVYYRQPVYRAARYVYQPRYTIDTGVSLLVHMFVRPNARQYYFGDYYGPRYADTYQPWVTRYQQPSYYDPFFAQYRYREVDRTADVLTWITTQHQLFARSEQLRPARTIAQQREFVRAAVDSGLDPTVVRLATFGETIENVAEDTGTPFRFERLAQDELQEIVQTMEPLRELGRSRQQVETVAASSETAAADTAAADTAAADTAAADTAAADADVADADAPVRALSPDETRPDVGARRSTTAEARAGLQLPPLTAPVGALVPGGEPAAGQPIVGRQPVVAPGTIVGDAAEPPGLEIGRALPPGRLATELTPQEQRDRRTDARAATPPITGQTPAIGEDPGLAAEMPAGNLDKPGVAGRRRGVTGARPGVTGARPIDTQRGAEQRPPAAVPVPALGVAEPLSDAAGQRTDAAGQRRGMREQAAGGAAQRTDAAEQRADADGQGATSAGQRADVRQQQPDQRRQGAGVQAGDRQTGDDQLGDRQPRDGQPGGSQQLGDRQPRDRQPQTGRGADQRDAAVPGQLQGATGQRPDMRRDPRPGAAGQLGSSVPSQRPDAQGRDATVTGQRPGVAGQTGRQAGQSAGQAAGETAVRPGQQATQQLPTAQSRDPEAGQRLRGDLRIIPSDRSDRGQSRIGAVPRMRPVQPEGWPTTPLRPSEPRTLPNRPAFDEGLRPGGRPAVGGAAADLPAGAVPRAGLLAPAGAPGVARGAPDRSGTARQREAQPFTLPDISEEEARRAAEER